ncbi:MAG: hypothetical protein PHD95_06985 [Candidatus ainarchaeum sp.]|nr:hypothetical protein [Candidatus ainarchaeum sp.]
MNSGYPNRCIVFEGDEINLPAVKKMLKDGKAELFHERNGKPFVAKFDLRNYTDEVNPQTGMWAPTERRKKRRRSTDK